MKRTLYALFALLLLAVPVGMAQNLIPVNFQSKWFPQAQFAGYFVAQDKGFYAEEGLVVTVLDGGNVNPTVAVASGNADFGTDWVANILTQRDQGLNVVNIAQMYVADPRFTRTYDEASPGLAGWVHDIIVANAANYDD